MKAAIVLIADAPDIARQTADMSRQAADMAALVSDLADHISALDLWLFHAGPPPAVIPRWPVPLEHVYRIRIQAPFVPEMLLDLLVQTARKYPKDLYFFGSSTMSQTLAVRLGFRLKGSICNQVETCKPHTENTLITFRPAYGSHMKAQFLLNKKPWCLSAVRTAASVLKTISPACPVTDLSYGVLPRPGWLKDIQLFSDESASQLEGADRILVLGNGISSKKNLEKIRPVARTLNAVLGASRPVVMNAWMPMDTLIGVSGAVVSPCLCIAAGVSGTGVFSAGITNAQFVVAINTDPDAPIFRVADVGIVDDLVAVLLALDLLVREVKKND